MVNINNAFPSKWLKAADLQGTDHQVTIKSVTFEDVDGDQKPVVHFNEFDKGLILNKTNASNISAIYSPETDGWAGKQVILVTAWVDFQGQSVEAIRVRPPQGAATPAPAGQPVAGGVPNPDHPFAPGNTQ